MRLQRGPDQRYLRCAVPVLIALLLLAACGTATAPPPSPGVPTSGMVVATGRTPDGRFVLLSKSGEKILSVFDGAVSDETAGTWLWPPIVDSHVHLAFHPVGKELAAHGVGAVVDLGAPEGTLRTTAPLTIIASGPMITRANGYPLSSWGANGYGIECGDRACVIATIDRLAAAGARVIKLPLDTDGLTDDLVAPAVEHAHGKGLKVVVHALTNEAALRAASAGVDLLAHTPLEPLTEATVTAWRGRAVISTLAAFGGSRSAIDNLRRLRAAGVTILYGTDLGNLRVDGPSAQEMKLLSDAGLDEAAITAAMTTAPIAYWGLPLTLAAGDEATLLILDGDPRKGAYELVRPRAVIHRGQVQ